LGDIGPIIISLEEITCCYLVKCKLVLATGYYYEIYNKTGTLPPRASSTKTRIETPYPLTAA
ncbi:MAG: hypothetical protein WAW52_03955, partial [Methanothrix sp.]